MSLTGILDDDEMVTTGNLQNRIHVCRLAVQVDRQDGPGALGDRCLDQTRVDGVGLRVDVHEHGRGAAVADRRDGGNEGERHGDDFVAGPDAGGEQGQVQRAGARVHANRVISAAIRREFLFEAPDLRAQHEVLAF